MEERGEVGRAVYKRNEEWRGRVIEKEREGHRYTAIRRKSNEDENRGRGTEETQTKETKGSRWRRRWEDWQVGKCLLWKMLERGMRGP